MRLIKLLHLLEISNGSRYQTFLSYFRDAKSVKLDIFLANKSGWDCVGNLIESVPWRGFFH